MYFLFTPSEAASIVDIEGDRYQHNRTLERLWKVADNRNVKVLERRAPQNMPTTVKWRHITNGLLDAVASSFNLNLVAAREGNPADTMHIEHKQPSNGKWATHRVI